MSDPTSLEAMPMPRAVLFDVDGVLVDSYEAHFRSWRLMFGELGVEFAEDQFRATFGRTNRDIFAQLFPGKASADQVRRWGERKEKLYREILRSDFSPIAGAGALIDALAAAGFLLGVGSSGPPENVLLTLELLERRDRFSTLVTGADVVRGKPDPQVFLLGAERLKIAPSACAVIEDAPQGIEAANRAGMASVALTGTATRTALAHARLIVDRLGELTPDAIGSLIADSDPMANSDPMADSDPMANSAPMADSAPMAKNR